MLHTHFDKDFNMIDHKGKTKITPPPKRKQIKKTKTKSIELITAWEEEEECWWIREFISIKFLSTSSSIYISAFASKYMIWTKLMSIADRVNKWTVKDKMVSCH